MMFAVVVYGDCLVCVCSCPSEDCGSIKFTPLEGKCHNYMRDLVHANQYGRLLAWSLPKMHRLEEGMETRL